MWKVFTKTDLELLIFFKCNGKDDKKPNLGKRILRRMDEMDLSKYKDSMAPLIRKDMEALTRKITEKQGEK